MRSISEGGTSSAFASANKVRRVGDLMPRSNMLMYTGVRSQAKAKASCDRPRFFRVALNASPKACSGVKGTSEI